MKNNRIVIGYKNPIGYFQEVVITRHRHLDDLIIDLKRMIQHCDDTYLTAFSGVSIFGLGTIDDETGKMENYETAEFLTEFPVVAKEVKE